MASPERSKSTKLITGDRKRARAIAIETLSAIKEGKYTADGTIYDLTEASEYALQHTSYFSPSSLSDWASTLPISKIQSSHCTIRVEELSTLKAACHIHHSRVSLGLDSDSRIGVLNFASAKSEGGGFLSGALAQEETIARSSTLHPTLKTAEAQQYYTLNRAPRNKAYYTHAMIYSPRVQLIRDDDTGDASWHAPVEVDVLTSPAVNAGAVMRKIEDESDTTTERERIKDIMAERMARILLLFEHQGADALILGSFGTGAFKNDVGTIAGLWKSLFEPGARFAQSFRLVVFAVIPNPTYMQFKDILGHLER